jgi:hypothetical protein
VVSEFHVDEASFQEWFLFGKDGAGCVLLSQEMGQCSGVVVLFDLSYSEGKARYLYRCEGGIDMLFDVICWGAGCLWVSEANYPPLPDGDGWFYFVSLGVSRNRGCYIDITHDSVRGFDLDCGFLWRSRVSIWLGG